MLIKCEPAHFDEIRDIINDAAIAYKGVIPDDCWHEPYMSGDELANQIADGVEFWGYFENDSLIGVMGIQHKQDVTLIRHAYVRTESRNKGIGAKLLLHLTAVATGPVLIGTWAAADWAIGFYRKHGFRLLPEEDKDRLLDRYWRIPARQKHTSVVLAGPNWAP
ncbi:MAG: GNAT family N-acetyltransferase [Chitinophagaceae bacterium]|nr:GNAT family N-acetyltransferase [Chitinophagaceae bacterium]